MSHFSRRQHLREQVPGILADQVAGFKDSPEYGQMTRYELEIPGVVCSYFAKYLQRLHKQHLRGEDTDSDRTRQCIQSAHKVLNLLASSKETNELVTDEVFEALDSTPDVLADLTRSLGPDARRLFAAWRTSNQV